MRTLGKVVLDCSILPVYNNTTLNNINNLDVASKFQSATMNWVHFKTQVNSVVPNFVIIMGYEHLIP